VWSEADLVRAHAHCNYNREALANSARCGCFYCLAVYNPREIAAWIDPPPGTPYIGGYAETGRTALCAHCGIDAVLAEAAGFPLTAAFLAALHNRYFQ